MHIESITLTNFRCFGPGSVRIELESNLTVMVGANATGKSAAFEALARLFGITREERQVRPEDFHVPVDEEEAPDSRHLSVEVVIAFPELDNEDDDLAAETVPEFFLQMAATEDGRMKCRFRLEATWMDDALVGGTVSESLRVVHTFDRVYADDQWSPLRPADRARIQMIYVPASRDGARHVTAFLRGRLWRAAKWSDDLRSVVKQTASDLTEEFHSEPAVETVETALTKRWQELHQADTDANPAFRPVDSDFSEFVGKAQLLFEPTETGHERRADQLSDGQRSLLHIALTAATLDVEAMIASGLKEDEFDLELAGLPSLTILVVEEPENSLSPYFLSRIVLQMLGVAALRNAQAMVSSHSASVLGRVDPGSVRHFRLDAATREAVVNRLVLPEGDDERATYVREAVRAFPELYFAKFVVLGEGSSEEVALPILAEARDVAIDRSFVAVVPLGGRHVNHFWRLLSSLGIPHATLLDLDRGRDGGGEGRIRNVWKQLAAIGVDPFADIDGFDDVDDIKNLPNDDFERLTTALQELGVYFCAPLDLDMTLLVAYHDGYTSLGAGETGPHQSSAFAAVLGEGGDPQIYEGWDAEMRWYRYLFLGRSKPSTHLRVLSGIDRKVVARNIPEPLGALIYRIAAVVA